MKNTTKKLYRLSDNYIIAGVCAGLGEYFDIDPVVFRILFILLALGNGIGVVLYLILIVILPKKGSAEYNDEVRKKNAKEFVDELKQGAKSFAKEMKIEKRIEKNSNRDLLAVLLIVLGLTLFITKIFPMYWFRWDLFWPLMIVFVGFWMLFKKS